jgi:hypothetical protein
MTVFEHMPLMPAATSAMVFYALSRQPLIDLGFNMAFDHVKKTWPTFSSESTIARKVKAMISGL